MPNQDAVEDVHVIQHPAVTYESARRPSSGTEQDDRSALLRALLVHGLSGAMNEVTRNTAT